MRSRKNCFRIEYRITSPDTESLIPTGKLLEPVVRRYK